MNETEIRALGFEPWYGGDEAPGDIQPETKAIYRDRKTAQTASSWRHPWCDGTGTSEYDIIGYKKKETAMEYQEWVVSRAHELADNFPALCQMILDHEQPPVDPDVALAEKHADMYFNDPHIAVEDAILAAIKEARNA